MDFDCFLAQGGSKDPAEKKNGKFTSSKFKLSQVEEIFDLSCTLVEKACTKRKIALSSNEQMIAVESIFRTVSGNFKA